VIDNVSLSLELTVKPLEDVGRKPTEPLEKPFTKKIPKLRRGSLQISNTDDTQVLFKIKYSSDDQQRDQEKGRTAEPDIKSITKETTRPPTVSVEEVGCCTEIMKLL